MKYVLLLTLVLATVGITLWNQTSKGQVAAEPSGLATHAPSTQPATSTLRVHGYGYTEPVGEVRRLRFRADGVIRQVHVRVGQRCKVGEPLMSLHDDHLKAELGAAEASLALVQAERAKVLSGAQAEELEAAGRQIELWRERLRFATSQLGRVEQMYANRATSVAELDKARTEQIQAELSLSMADIELTRLKNVTRPEDRELAEVRIKVGESRVAQVRQRLDETVLAAPFDGTVLEVLRREGEASQGTDGTPPLIYGDLSRLRVRAEIDERYAYRIKVGQKVSIGGPTIEGRTFEGRVAEIHRIMGRKTVFSRDPSEKKDLDVLQVIVDLDGVMDVPVGLQVDVVVDLAPAGDEAERS